MRFVRFFGAMAVILLAAGGVFGQNMEATITSPQLPMPGGVPDTIYYNGKIITVDSGFTAQQAFAVKGEQFLAVGTDAQIRKLAGPGTRQIDLKGMTVLPGLGDSHDHLYAQAMAHRGVDISGAKSTSEILDQIRKAVANAKPGEVVFTTGGYFCAPPTAQDLDAISTTVPIIMARGEGGGGEGRGPIMNQAAKKAPDAGPGLVPTGATGDLPGRDGPYDRISMKIPPPTNEEEETLLLKVMREKNAEGITSFSDLSIYPSAWRAYYRLWREGKLSMRASLALRIVPVDGVEDVLSRWGVGVGFGDHWMRVDSISEDPHPRSGHELLGTDFTQAMQDDFVKAMIAVDRMDWRPALADQGGCNPACQSAMELDLRAYEAADKVAPIKGKRWIILQGPQPTPDQLDRMAKLGVILVSPLFPVGFVPSEDDRMAEETAPVGDYLKHHVVVVKGTDMHSFDRDDNPFLAFHWMVTRKTRDGKQFGPEQIISREDALRLMTNNDAYVTFEENVKGSIEPGKLADFVIVDQNIMTVPEEKILDTHALATFVGGKEVYAAQGSGF